MELLERFAAGDPSAFETLFHQFQGEVYRWIVRITRDPVVAEDLTIETFGVFIGLDADSTLHAVLRRGRGRLPRT